ncbi:class I SAM-dependent methyltransferase [Kitasatospora sp. NPDC058115]|uniref:class I SAM-dependent methyltransferase n=1 Tax=Kitasatospora sp. NPDC058115 TaxID=3346347 RepID=UPI0036DDDCFE
MTAVPPATPSRRRSTVGRVVAGTAAVASAAALAGAAARWPAAAAPAPYVRRGRFDRPLPLLSLRRLDGLLRARAGERLLEIGPGSGRQALHVAPQLGREGRLDIVDVRHRALDRVVRRAAGSGIGTIVPCLADVHHLPFGDAVFDAAYLVTVLGELPAPTGTLAELRRVLKPGGRLVVGECFHRHQLRVPALAAHAARAGLRVEALSGPSFAYFALLQPLPGRR